MRFLLIIFSLFSFLTGKSQCVNWYNGFPNDPELLNAAEYLCSNNVIPYLQDASLLDQSMSLVEESDYVTNSLFNQNSPLPSDYYPILHTDVDVSYYIPRVIRALRAMLFLEYSDGRSPISRDYFFLKSGQPLELSKALRVIYEAWNLQGNWSGYDPYSENQSSFICNLKRDDPFYGYVQDAMNNGWLNGIVFYSNCPLPFLPQNLTRRSFYKILFRVMVTRPYPNPTVNSFYQPLNVSTQNASAAQDLQNGAFSNYEESSFNISGAGFPLVFRHIYNSSLLELPILDHQIGPDLQILEYRQKESFSPLGIGWTHSFNIYMQASTQPSGIDKNLIIRWGDGTANVYDLIQHTYSTKGVYDNLIVTSTTGNGNPNTVLITKKDQTQYLFQRDGQGQVFTIQSIKDRNNNYLLFNWVKGDPFFVNGQDLAPLRLQKVYDPNTGRAISFSYQPGTNYISYVTDNIGRTLSFNVNKFSQNLLNFNDAKGLGTAYIYGFGDTAIHLLKKIQRPKGNFIDNAYQNRKIKSSQANQYKIDINFTANYLNNGISTQSNITVTPQTGQSYTTNYQNDYLGNAVQINSATSSNTIQYNDPLNPTLPTKIIDNKLNITNQFTYDNRGNTLKAEKIASGYYSSLQYQYNGFNDVTQYTDALLNRTNYSYDGRGNLIFKTMPSGEFIEYIRNNFGNVYQVNDNGVVTDIGYNNYGNVDSLRIATINVSAKAYYDPVSRVTAIRNPNGSIQGIKYDNNDNVTETVDDSTGLKIRRSYTYDANDNLIQVKNAKGYSTYLDYDFDTDDLIRERFGPHSKEWTYNKDGTIKTRKNKNNFVFNHTYFPQGNQLEGLLQTDGYANYNYNNQTKQLLSVERQGKTISYGYDNLGRVTSVQYNDFPNNQLLYEYDANDNLTKITYPGGKWIKYIYDGNNRVSGLVDWNNQLFQEYHYANNRIDYETHSGISKTYYKYDAGGRLTKIINLRNIDTLSSYTATLDGAGNHIQEIRKENYNPIQDDFPSNPITTYTYDSLNRLKTANSVNINYDNDGNTISYGTTSFTYDENDRLLSVGPDINDYDPLGNRRKRNNTRYVVDILNGNNVMMETDNAGNPLTLYVYGLGLVRRYDFSTNRDYYYNYDFRGSVTSILDGNNQLANWYTYGANGEILRKSETIQQPFKYVGKWGVQQDNDSLYFMQARYYNPKSGRFLSEDPVWHPNLYPYGDDNPLINIDPDGKDAWDFVPIVGSTRDAMNSARKGNYGWAVFHTAMAISDVFLLKSIVKGVVQGGGKLLIKNYKTWNSARKLLGNSESTISSFGEQSFAKSGQEIHHWLIPQNSWGKYVPPQIKNQMFNLMPTRDRLWHNAIEGKGAQAMNMSRRLWYGSPSWFKNGVLYIIKGIGR